MTKESVDWHKFKADLEEFTQYSDFLDLQLLIYVMILLLREHMYKILYHLI